MLLDREQAMGRVEEADVIIIGAGLSGIDAAYRLATERPDSTIVILESREAIGGTWDLFRYPGIRSDSDMATLGFPFRPWREEESIAGGEAIRAYIEDTAREFDIDRLIRFSSRVLQASWSTDEARWLLEIDRRGERVNMRCAFLYICAGYYDYSEGYSPNLAGIEDFEGEVIHPQHWPADVETRGKKIAVVGSGATAITLVPSLCKDAASVSMIQRSPTYIVSRPARDRVAIVAQKFLPGWIASRLVRWKNILFGIITYSLARRRPAVIRSRLLEGVREELGPNYDIDRDFTPRYDPWDQRVCLVPDGDLFAAIRGGKAEVITDTIDRLTPSGVLLSSGRTVPADILVLATGLKVQMMGGIDLVVDGKPVSAAGRMAYRGAMLDGIPNLAFAFGYTNASWTLKCDLSAKFVCRLLGHMKRTGVQICVPRAGAGVEQEDMVGLQSGYIKRASSIMPTQGTKSPWRVNQNYLADLVDLSFASVSDGELQFSNPSGAVS